MKHITTFLFAAVLGAILAGCGGGGSGSAAPNMEIAGTFRALTAQEMNELQTKMTVAYTIDNWDENDLSIFNRVDPSWQVMLSPHTLYINNWNLCDGYANSNGDNRCGELRNADNGTPDTDTRNVISINQPAGFTRVYEINTVVNGITITTQTATVVVMTQNGTNYIATQCSDDMCLSSFGTPLVNSFTMPAFEYETQNVFYFNRGLIRNARQFGGFHINAEDKHVEYRYTPFSDVFIDSGYRRFNDAAVAYSKVQMDYKNFYLQYIAGDVKSDYYKEEIINGFAFGWQNDNFSAKMEKPFGGGNEAWLRLFYKKEWK